MYSEYIDGDEWGRDIPTILPGRSIFVQYILQCMQI